MLTCVIVQNIGMAPAANYEKSIRAGDQFPSVTIIPSDLKYFALGSNFAGVDPRGRPPGGEGTHSYNASLIKG